MLLSVVLRGIVRMCGLACSGGIQLRQRPIEDLESRESCGPVNTSFQVHYSRHAAVIENDKILGKRFDIGRIMRDDEHRHLEA